MTAQARPTFSNDRVFFWTRVAEFIFVLAVPGALVIDGPSGLPVALLQLGVLLLITTWLRRRRLAKWQQAGGTG